MPICLSYLDYGRLRGGFGPCFMPSGNLKADMDIVRAFYRDVQARCPEKFTPPRLREEEDAPSSDEAPLPPPPAAVEASDVARV